MRDQWGREIHYLRISVTDRCNFRCMYCMPPEGIGVKPHKDILTYEEIIAIVREGVELGINRVRITGGEPLVRKGMIQFVEQLRSIKGLEEIAMTTNGSLLSPVASKLAQAGLDRVNISMDSPDPELFSRMTRTEGMFQSVIQGIEAALQAGLTPIKVNAVIMKGVNDHWEKFLTFLGRYPVSLRFIELMPIGPVARWKDQGYVSVDEMREMLMQYGQLIPVTSSQPGNGPAKYYKLGGYEGTIGLITPLSQHFCEQCNRIRLTADGKLKSCLLSEKHELDLLPFLRPEVNGERLREEMETTIATKPAQHCLVGREQSLQSRCMVQIGG